MPEPTSKRDEMTIEILKQKNLEMRHYAVAVVAISKWLLKQVEMYAPKDVLESRMVYGSRDVVEKASQNIGATSDRYVVACVNACKGLRPEAVPELLPALQGLLAYVHDLHDDPDKGGLRFLDFVWAAEAVIAKALENAPQPKGEKDV